MELPTVLLTGATGFVGGATLARLLEFQPIARVLLLARDRGLTTATERVRQSLTRFIGSELAESRLAFCEVINADLTEPASLATPRLDEVTHVLHLAANTNLRSIRRVRHTNVFGTMTLAHRLRRVPNLQRFLYVGTSYICGENAEPVVHEEKYPRPTARHFTEYTASKAECEMLLNSTAPELPLVVARPSVVVGHTQLGCGPSASIFWFYRACEALRRLTCSLKSKDDVVPVDWVAEALLLLLFKPDLKHRQYHVSAGEASSVEWQDIAAAFAECYGRRPEEPYQVVDLSTIERERGRIRKLLSPVDDELLMAALAIFYRFMAIKGEVFDNSRLLNEGMHPAPKFTSYLKQCTDSSSGKGVYQQMLEDV